MCASKIDYRACHACWSCGTSPEVHDVGKRDAGLEDAHARIDIGQQAPRAIIHAVGDGRCQVLRRLVTDQHLLKEAHIDGCVYF